MNKSLNKSSSEMLRRNILMGVMLAATSMIATGQTQAWPQRPVTIVVAFAPGGMTDIIGRVLAKELSDEFKQPFVIENKAGAAGQLGTEYVAKRPNDGYTLLITATGFVMAPAIQNKINYVPLKDFEPIAVLASAPNLLVVNPKVPAKTFPQFLDWVKNQNGVSYGSAGVGGSTHLAGELLRHETGAKMTHVPYRGATFVTSDLVAGQIEVAIQDSVSVSSFIESGKVRPIAVTSAKRSKLFPDLPTLKEQGFKDFDVYTWLGLYAPAGTPSDVVARINAAANRFMNSEKMSERLKELSGESVGSMDVAQTRNYVAKELTKWRDLIKTTGVKITD